MLTESVSDPRRANWLTITSMSDDLCWPDEPSTTRPNWELEAEILRLTTRLMMRERELRQAKTQLKAQASKAQAQAASFRRRMEEKELQVQELLLQKDAEMQNIVSQLLLFEAELRREQSRIEDLLGEKDAQIRAQRKEIDRLKNYEAKDSFPDNNPGCVDAKTPCPEESGVVKNFAYNDAKTSHPEGNGSVKNFAYNALKTSNPEDSGVVRNFAYNVNSEGSGVVQNFANDDAKLSNPEDSGVVISSSDSCPSPLEDISDMKEERFPPRQCHFHPAIFEDPYDSQLAVQKLRDGLVKIRAIQDVTNVKSLDFSYDSVVQEKKRIPYRAPQKMKDLKAKRSINLHKIHRPVVGEINNQVVL